MLYGDIPLSLLARSYMRLQTKSASYWDATGKAGLYLKELRAHFEKYHTFIQRETIPQRRLWSLWTSALLLMTYFFQYCKGCSALREAEWRKAHRAPAPRMTEPQPYSRASSRAPLSAESQLLASTHPWIGIIQHNKNDEDVGILGSLDCR